MTDTPNPTTSSTARPTDSDATDAGITNPSSRSLSRLDERPWERLATADPIAVRDPLAEVLGMVPEGDPLTVTFAEVAKAAGHACPAVSGAYRATQIGLDALYPDALPVRSEIAVTVYGSPDEPGLGPMASVVTQITGAADETGFGGFGGYGGRTNLREFDPDTDTGPGRTFEFRRTDTDDAVRVTFDPSAVGMHPDKHGDGPGSNDGTDAGGSGGSGGSAGPMAMLPKLVAGDATDAERERFLDTWHGRVQRILESEPGEQSPFTLERR